MAVTGLLVFLSFLTFSSALIEGNCVNHDTGLKWLASKLSSGAAISCLGSPLQQYNAGRYWGAQYGKNASVVIFPVTAQDVSYAVQASCKTPLGNNLAFVSGAHGQTNASSSTGMVIDLTWMNKTTIEQNKVIDGKSYTVVGYQGGATWGQVQTATNGTGYTPIGARVSNVGTGGFSTGGGIGFLAGAYGYAIDRLRAMDVVLMDGRIVTATAKNKYSDLFWALQGGGGQFGIVTTFYQEAAAEPTDARFGVWYISNSTTAVARQNTVDFFNNHTDPFSLMYYATGYVPLADGTLGTQTLLVGVWFGNPNNPSQPSFNKTFTPLLHGLDIVQNITIQVPYADAFQVIDTFFPYGFRRGFWGPQTTEITASYLANASATLTSYVSSLLARGETPVSALWALQYMSPGLNGHLPTSDSATAWPHSVAGHQTLFSPAWSSVADDAVTSAENDVLNALTYSHQQSVGPFLADYPNYISPNASGRRVWGENVERLIEVKAKYDPQCRIHQGRVFASRQCVQGGWANIFPN